MVSTLCGRNIDNFLCQNMSNYKKKNSGGVSFSACNAFILFARHQTSIKST